MKDAGCSSNSARVSQLFGGDDQNAKRGLWERDWRKWGERIAYALEYTEPDGSPLERLRRFGTLALAGPSSQRELFEIRCDRGANIARALGVSEATAVAIRAMDEHWDGGGYPTGLRRDEIPLCARIVGLAQVVEIYWRLGGIGAGLEVARERRGRWFDPALVKAFCALGPDDRVWSDLHTEPLSDAIATAEPIERAIPADESRLDRIARAFALVVDAKSAFTYDHSDRVAAISEAIATDMSVPGPQRVRLRRAALLHDIGKLSVPNRILDKPGKLDADEWAVVKRHPHFTYEILARVPVFSEFAYDASCHHERIDGRGYHRGSRAMACPSPRASWRPPISSTRSPPPGPIAARCRSSRCSRSLVRGAARSSVRQRLTRCSRLPAETTPVRQHPYRQAFRGPPDAAYSRATSR